MTVQWSTLLRNALLNSIESTIGTSPKVQIRTGAQPASAGAAATGTLLAEFTLAADWMADAAAGSKTFSGLPVSIAAVGAGTAAHYRLNASDGTCHEQGSVTVTGGGGDMTIDNPNVAVGQNVQITAWSKTAPGA